MGWQESDTTATEHAAHTLVVQWLRLRPPRAGGPGSTSSWRTRSHMPQLRVRVLQLTPGIAK